MLDFLYLFFCLVFFLSCWGMALGLDNLRGG